ncbi:anaerobic ribonucleoside-triphosphate reductase activating protein [Acetatifactor muris]|jgi:anaerobic ribonucleoside-triphosphate reductase activating protein|uniref:Anaerobic ribonucleoside-triphosphate reductase-activating protein n=1 Tax=Acetatifactor muris TaxID=879566 RepID=A0A2K4ZC09_9FIRM|nr:anaerobic ribonucleoside-triphosphate reductase activating protein [Acetatifactor muris]MCR2046435.1 anaerobic ribonucleoside-triphosphate reductase activating protein [Acetatifactor muris]SOY27996.1 anaerobic ribonucleotide reductase-activating protein [Acetatifactor muris]
MKYASIKKTDVANGPGIRVSLFVSGCTHKCKGCFNSEAWDFNYGRDYSRETEAEILQALAPDYIRGLSILGGEPMEPENRETVLALLKAVRKQYPGKDIWCYTGYDYEKDLLVWAGGGSWGGTESAEDGTVRELLDCIDVLVDGEFVEERKNLRLAFRGSDNQRLIAVGESLRQGRVVCLPDKSF